MTNFAEFPVEILRLVLGALADVDLLSLFVARGTCRKIQQAATDIICNTFSDHGTAIHKLLASHFAPILDSSKTVPEYQPTYTRGWAPFFSLPWASNELTRNKYLREEASWRQIPLSSGSGHLVHRLQMVTQTQQVGKIDWIAGGNVAFRLVAEGGAERFYFPKGLTLGLLYDILLGNASTSLKGGWKLLQEKRVRDPDEFEKMSNDLKEGRVERISSEEVMSLLTHDTQYAVLLFIGKSCEGVGRNRSELWRPLRLGDDENVLWEFMYSLQES